MKQLLIFVLLTFPFISHAQLSKYDRKQIAETRVIYFPDTVYSNGKPYCLMMKSGSTLFTNFSVRSLSGKELMYFKYQSDHVPVLYEVTFFPKLDKLHINYMISSKLAYFLVDNNLVSGDSVPVEGKQRMISLYGVDDKMKKDSTNSSHVVWSTKDDVKDGSDQIVLRNHSMPVTMKGDSIQQDGKTIGFIVTTTKNVDDATWEDLSIFLPSGIQVAQSSHKLNVSAISGHVTTAKDNEEHTIVLKGGKSSSFAGDIIDFLIDHFYL